MGKYRKEPQGKHYASEDKNFHRILSKIMKIYLKHMRKNKCKSNGKNKCNNEAQGEADLKEEYEQFQKWFNQLEKNQLVQNNKQLLRKHHKLLYGESKKFYQNFLIRYESCKRIKKYMQNKNEDKFIANYQKFLQSLEKWNQCQKALKNQNAGYNNFPEEDNEKPIFQMNFEVEESQPDNESIQFENSTPTNNDNNSKEKTTQNVTETLIESTIDDNQIQQHSQDTTVEQISKYDNRNHIKAFFIRLKSQEFQQFFCKNKQCSKLFESFQQYLLDYGRTVFIKKEQIRNFLGHLDIECYESWYQHLKQFQKQYQAYQDYKELRQKQKKELSHKKKKENELKNQQKIVKEKNKTEEKLQIPMDDEDEDDYICDKQFQREVEKKFKYLPDESEDQYFKVSIDTLIKLFYFWFSINKKENLDHNQLIQEFLKQFNQPQFYQPSRYEEQVQKCSSDFERFHNLKQLLNYELEQYLDTETRSIRFQSLCFGGQNIIYQDQKLKELQEQLKNINDPNNQFGILQEFYFQFHQFIFEQYTGINLLKRMNKSPMSKQIYLFKKQIKQWCSKYGVDILLKFKVFLQISFNQQYGTNSNTQMQIDKNFHFNKKEYYQLSYDLIEEMKKIYGKQQMQPQKSKNE